MNTTIAFNADDATFAGIQDRASTIANLTCTWSSDGSARTAFGEVRNPFAGQPFPGLADYAASRFGGLERYITISGGTDVVRTDAP